MRKISLFLLFFAIFIFAACGGSKNDDKTDSDRPEGSLYGKCYQNKTCNKGLECDTENNICIKESEKSENEDISNTDESNNDEDDSHECEPGEFACKKDSLINIEYSMRCDSDSLEYGKFEICKDTCDSSTGKCSPWRDPDTNLIWSLHAHIEMSLEKAISYCENLKEGSEGRNWRLPTIDELRTLIRDCSSTVIEGTCKVSADNDCLSQKECWTEEDCNGCIYDSNEPNNYSKMDIIFGSSTKYWSASFRSDYPSDHAYFIDFSTGAISAYYKDSQISVRCVK